MNPLQDDIPQVGNIIKQLLTRNAVYFSLIAGGLAAIAGLWADQLSDSMKFLICVLFAGLGIFGFLGVR